jgi:hypothetical protein
VSENSIVLQRGVIGCAMFFHPGNNLPSNHVMVQWHYVQCDNTHILCETAVDLASLSQGSSAIQVMNSGYLQSLLMHAVTDHKDR